MLSRETYKWLQSLDLKVKNPKRDLANGVVIAEIFSRYFPNQLNIDLFYSGFFYFIFILFFSSYIFRFLQTISKYTGFRLWNGTETE
ncbi:hypothetical protein BDR26DRAFT_864491 [Obelidium mucronatum]|nr:hypothetical protein BDR26DRAFT_864491 [Obelidium mucronatum]